ncbi:Hypothetical_protein [Hexamita inflata]|uniref:Hypothetical_protein n=1 Tax=Hexamita inflata TaxID=28002 RepID=A0AA86PNU7_9EUKA|nr:Hypothetical protein HINF_LOCUS29713 [Hexamita inflata]
MYDIDISVCPTRWASFQTAFELLSKCIPSNMLVDMKIVQFISATILQVEANHIDHSNWDRLINELKTNLRNIFNDAGDVDDRAQLMLQIIESREDKICYLIQRQYGRTTSTWLAYQVYLKHQQLVMVALNDYLASITDKQVTFQEEIQIIKHLMQWLTFMQKKQLITLITFIQTMMKTMNMSDIHLIVHIINVLQIQIDDKIPINHYNLDNFQCILALKLALILYVTANVFKHAAKNDAKKIYPGSTIAKHALFLRV